MALCLLCFAAASDLPAHKFPVFPEWLLLNWHMYGLNNVKIPPVPKPSEYEAHQQFATAIERDLCDTKFLSSCPYKALSPADIKEKMRLNASWWSEDPPILKIENFLSEEEADTLIRWGEPIMEPIGSQGAGEINEELRNNDRIDVRRDVLTAGKDGISKFGQPISLHDEAVRQVAQDVMQRTSVLTGAPVEQLENLQVQRTQPGEYFKEHHDFSYDFEEFCFGEGPRPYTLLAYLSDDFDGGATSFPRIGVATVPKKGDAVLWPNSYRGTLLRDFRTNHQGDPVTRGIKYAANINVRAGRMRDELFDEDTRSDEGQDDHPWRAHVSKLFKNFGKIGTKLAKIGKPFEPVRGGLFQKILKPKLGLDDRMNTLVAAMTKCEVEKGSAAGPPKYVFDVGPVTATGHSEL